MLIRKHLKLNIDVQKINTEFIKNQLKPIITSQDKINYPTYSKKFKNEALLLIEKKDNNLHLKKSINLHDFTYRNCEFNKIFLNKIYLSENLNSNIKNANARLAKLPIFKVDIHKFKDQNNKFKIIKLYSIEFGFTPKQAKMLSNLISNESFMMCLANQVANKCKVKVPNIYSWGTFRIAENYVFKKYIPFGYICMSFFGKKWREFSQTKCPDNYKLIIDRVIQANICFKKYSIYHNDLYIKSKNTINKRNLMLNQKTDDVAIIDFGESTLYNESDDSTFMNLLSPLEYFKE